MTLGEYDELINSDEYYENHFEETYPFFKNDEYMIELNETSIYVPELKIIIKQGVNLAYDEDEEGYTPDYDLTIFFDLESKKWLYEESSSSINVCISNYCNGVGISHENIEDMECEIIENEEIYDDNYGL